MSTKLEEIIQKFDLTDPAYEKFNKYIKVYVLKESSRKVQGSQLFKTDFLLDLDSPKSEEWHALTEELKGIVDKRYQAAPKPESRDESACSRREDVLSGMTFIAKLPGDKPEQFIELVSIRVEHLCLIEQEGSPTPRPPMPIDKDLSFLDFVYLKEDEFKRCLTEYEQLVSMLSTLGENKVYDAIVKDRNLLVLSLYMSKSIALLRFLYDMTENEKRKETSDIAKEFIEIIEDFGNGPLPNIDSIFVNNFLSDALSKNEFGCAVNHQIESFLKADKAVFDLVFRVMCECKHKRASSEEDLTNLASMLRMDPIYRFFIRKHREAVDLFLATIDG